MAKFGELINNKEPVLIAFYSEFTMDFDKLHSILREVAANFGDKVKVVKIDINKNETLTNALRIKVTPSYFIYKDAEMKWRQGGEHTTEQLISNLNSFI